MAYTELRGLLIWERRNTGPTPIGRIPRGETKRGRNINHMSKRKYVRTIPELGTRLGPFRDIVVDDFTKHGTGDRIRYWVIMECTRCKKEYTGRTSSVRYGKTYCKCRKMGLVEYKAWIAS